MISLHDLLDAVNQHLFCPTPAGILRLAEGFHLTPSCKIQVMIIMVPGVAFHLNFISIYLFAVKYRFILPQFQLLETLELLGSGVERVQSSLVFKPVRGSCIFPRKRPCTARKGNKNTLKKLPCVYTSVTHLQEAVEIQTDHLIGWGN